MRELFPLWRDDLPEDGSMPYWEWECQERDNDGYPLGSYGLICKDSDTFVDADHFVATKWEFSKDGYLGKLPYLVFTQPSFNGLLWINLENFSSCGTDVGYYGKEGFFLANLRDLNIWLQLFGDCLLSSLSF